MRKLKITIEGKPGTGKTLAATLIEAALRDAGLRVEQRDPDLCGERGEAFRQRRASYQDRVAAAVGDVQITIETKMVKRQAAASE